MAEKKEKQYVSDNARLMAEWNWEKNNELGFDPNCITHQSNKSVWWECNKNHEWKATIYNRAKGKGCPYCSNKRILKGYNDLQTLNPTLSQEWNYEKNGELKPDSFVVNSGKKVWWKCSKGHEWQARIVDRNKERSCPYCFGRYAVKGKNDLQTVNPTLAKEWNYEKNEDLKPENFTASSGKKVWWKCNQEHEWQARIASRNAGEGCPICDSEKHTSFPEYALVYYFKKYGLEVIHSYKEKGFELDIYIPEKKVAIEYDGYFWHKNKAKKDLEKNQKCKKEGITLYRIREELPSLNNSSIDYVVHRNQKDLSSVIREILSEIIGVNIDVDIERDIIAIENLREHTKKENSLLFFNSEVAGEWNYIENGNLKPENFAANSNKKVWWICSKGHEWQASIASRNSGAGCPYCTGQKAISGYNDLQTINPTLSKEWNYEKNGYLSPDNFTANSGIKVWWICSKGHEWQATISDRNNKSGCPYCSGRKVLKGYNDLKTIDPNLAKEWNYEKNDDLSPENFTANSHKKVWWICSKEHEWQASIGDRYTGHGYPYCSGKKVLKGYNDLQTINPLLAKEWNYEKNGDLFPDDFTASSGKKVWWKCNKQHEWQATIGDRNNSRGCPYCSGRYAVKGQNDLQTVNPPLVKEWNYEKNGDLMPENFTGNSSKKVWWFCHTCGHEWQAIIANRNKGHGCPECAKEKRKKAK